MLIKVLLHGKKKKERKKEKQIRKLEAGAKKNLFLILTLLFFWFRCNRCY